MSQVGVVRHETQPTGNWSPRPVLLARMRRTALGRPDLYLLFGLGLLLAVVFWPPWPLTPQAGLDSSWKAGLSWAHQLGLAWGPDVVFTYGPLFFLDYPLANSTQDLLTASLFWIAYAVTLTSAVFAALSVTRPKLAVRYRLGATLVSSALLLALPTANAFQLMHPLVPIALLTAALGAVFKVKWSPWIAGVALGMIALHTIYGAALVGAFVLISLTAALGLAGAVRLCFAVGVAFLALWLIDGQTLADLPYYIGTELELIRGYAPAMNVTNPAYVWQFVVAGALSLSCLWCANRVAHELPRGARLGFVAAVGAVLWLAAREAFTRHDGHYWHFFAVVVVLCVIFLLLRADRALIFIALATGAAAYLIATTIFVPFLKPIDRQQSIVAASRTLSVLLNLGEGDRVFRDAARSVADEYGMTAELTNVVQSAPTIADPWDISALLSVSGNWAPLPVIQNYSAYTPELDRLNTAALLARPRQILRSVPYPAIDGRNPYWESPGYQRLVYCSYEVQMTVPKWQLLVPSPETHCGTTLDPAGERDVAAGEVSPVPQRDGSLTLVTITPRTSILGEAIDLLTKPGPLFVDYGGKRWRLAQSPSAVGLMLNAPVPHPAFADLPLTPYPSISLSVPAHLAFSFAEVLSSAQLGD